MDFENDDQPYVVSNYDDIQFDDVDKPEHFQAKAQKLLSRVMDRLLYKIEVNEAESSDYKTAVDIAKYCRVGLRTVEGAVEKAAAEAAKFGEVELDESDEAYRFEG